MSGNGPLTVLLAGNPNVGKSTVFNALTGLRQHTGNWPGKTVETARGKYVYKGRLYQLLDLPGTYSLDARSREEQVARETLAQGGYDCVVAVCDAAMLRRNLILVYQILALGAPVVVCVNLVDEAARRGLAVDARRLSRLLGVPVVSTAANHGEGLAALQETVRQTAEGYFRPRPQPVPESRVERARLAEETARKVTSGTARESRARQLDRILTGRWTGIPLMLLLLFFLLWLTVAGANVPSGWLWRGTQWLYSQLCVWCGRWPWWLRGALLDGVFLTTGRVVSVMLPPMAIFFPLFTLLEDLGYLPRMAYNLDHALSRCGGCGKMAMTYCMGLGCNAAGVVGCRIIDSPRERCIAVLTNSFIPCNGRFGALILLLTVFLPSTAGSLWAALGLTGFLVLGVLAAMGVSWILSRTVLRGMPSAFTLELPPFRRPRVGHVLVRSALDRTGKVLLRAAVTAAPAGLVLWSLNTVDWHGVRLLDWMARGLDSMGRAMGMSGVLLAAFLLGWPANEIVLPVALLAATGALELDTTAEGLSALGLQWETALCTAVFFLFHWPCATTCLTIRRETESLKWTLLAMALPTILGAGMCLLIHAAM